MARKLKKNTITQNRFPRKMVWKDSITNSGATVYADEWIQHALTKGWVIAPATGPGTGGIYGGNGSLPTSTTVTLGSNSLTFDGSGGGFFTSTGVLASGRTTSITTGENLFGFGAKGTVIDVFNTSQQIDSLLALGDLTPLGLTSYPDGWILGIADLAGNKGSITVRGSADPATGATSGGLTTTITAGNTGNAFLDVSSINAGSGSANTVVGARAVNVPRITLDSNATGAGNASEIYFQVQNSTDGTVKAVTLDSLAGVTFYDAIGTTMFTIPWTFGDATYADDTAASGGGVAIGEWYLRTTGEVAQRLT